MAVVALALEVVFLAVAFGGRMLLQWQRTGDSGFRITPAMPVSARISSLLMTFGVGACGIAAALVALGARPSYGVVPTGFRVAGLGVSAIGIVVTFWSQLAMGGSWRIGVDDRERTELVTAGPFRIVRNPIFSAMVVASIGVALAVPTALSIAGAVAVLVGVETQVRLVEEPYLLRCHPQDYSTYAHRVGRFLPLVGQLGIGLDQV